MNHAAAEQERVQQHTAEQVVHVPMPQIQEQSAAGVKVITQENHLGRILEQIVGAPVPQGVKEVVSAAVDELTAAVSADELAPDVELDEARQRIRLRRVFDAPLAERSAQELIQEEDAATKSATASPIAKKRQRRANTKSEPWTVCGVAWPGSLGPSGTIFSESWKTCLTGTDSRILRYDADTASICVYRICGGGDVYVLLTLQNYVDAS